MAAIESRDYTLEQLFRDFYVVRAYQREYVWEDKHVKELLDDVFKQFSQNKSGSDWEYFIGSIIVCESHGAYELIDGQQRMTTAYLILCAVASYKTERLREDKIYEWLESNKEDCGYEKEPFDFINNLVKSAKAFVNFKRGNNSSGKPNRYLLNISYLSTTQHLILLLASQHLGENLFTELCKHIENFLFVHIITRVGTSKLESLFTQWASKLRNIKEQTAFDKFIEEHVYPEQKKLSELFELAFRQLNESSVQKKTMKYILAKITQHIDEEAYGCEAHAELKNYINKQVTIEHILSQKTSKTTKNMFDKPNEIDRYIQYIGNLTLLEASLNKS